MAEQGGLRIGSFAGAAIVIEPAFLLLALYVVGSAVVRGGVAALGSALVIVAVIFAAVLIHEMGHAGMAAALRIPSKRIVLTFFGGYVQFARAPKQLWHEIAVSSAGPGANLISYALVTALTPLLALALSPTPFTFAVLNALGMFGFISLLLGLFNLLPGFPLDGGNMLRAALSYVMPASNARVLTAACGLLIAAGLFAFAIWQQFWWTMFIAALLGLGAWAELRAARRAAQGASPSDTTSNA